MSLFKKEKARRAAIRENRPDLPGEFFRKLASGKALGALAIAGLFCLAAIAIVMLRDEVARYRPGQYTPQDIPSRVDFTFKDSGGLEAARTDARKAAMPVYKPTQKDNIALLRDELLAIPKQIEHRTIASLPDELRTKLGLTDNAGALTSWQQSKSYDRDVESYLAALKAGLGDRAILSDERHEQDRSHYIVLPGRGGINGRETTSKSDDDLRKIVHAAASKYFATAYRPSVEHFTLESIQPTYEYDEAASVARQNEDVAAVPDSRAEVDFKANQVLVSKNSIITERDWMILRQEQRAFIDSLGPKALEAKLGLLGLVLLVTIAMCIYIACYQPRIVHNHARAMALAALLIAMLLLAELAGIGKGTLYVFGIAPTLLAAMILAIAYDQRFALGMSALHGVLVAAALDQEISFLLVLCVGVATACFMLREVRSRSRLIEVGGATALTMILATVISGAIRYNPLSFIGADCLAVGAAGLGAGFVVLGILPFIERTFRITTNMSLLELADLSQPLLRRLAVEAPGTYSHSIQVATVAEAAAEAIGANGLLCRVGCYYHDVGKINKADYFVENQTDGRNRHINLNPNVSLLIIIGHVKDGIELAKEYNLPTVLFPFIQQHHGTTLVEYFYRQACNQKDPLTSDAPQVSDTQYRYPGPRPRTREVGVCMVADAVESATRAMVDPSASRIESLVHELVMRRLLDGQFDDCPLTLRELDQVERAMVKTLVGIYHGRLAYPSTRAATHGEAAPATARTA